MQLEDYVSLLNEEEITQIKEADEEYTFFDVSVFNTGAVARIEISSDIEPEWEEKMSEDTWNGYDAILCTYELQEFVRDK